jgi:hypothetical protein
MSTCRASRRGRNSDRRTLGAQDKNDDDAAVVSHDRTTTTPPDTTEQGGQAARCKRAQRGNEELRSVRERHFHRPVYRIDLAISDTVARGALALSPDGMESDTRKPTFASKKFRRARAGARLQVGLDPEETGFSRAFQSLSSPARSR